MNFKFILPAVLILLTVLTGCNDNNQKKIESVNSTDSTGEIVLNKELIESKGYELMSQKCFICHFQIPDPARRDQMLAPPFLRVQEHYKPAYPEKEKFIEAVMNIINDPSEEKTLMPGAVKKFNLMPKLVYDQDELMLIAEVLYELDFEDVPKMRMQMMHSKVQLNEGKKWELNQESIDLMNSAIDLVNNFDSDQIDQYNQLGKDVFDIAKKIMLNDSYEDELFDQIHSFFSGIEGNMHTLMAVRTMDEARKQLSELRTKLNEFNDFFE